MAKVMMTKVRMTKVRMTKVRMTKAWMAKVMMTKVRMTRVIMILMIKINNKEKVISAIAVNLISKSMKFLINLFQNHGEKDYNSARIIISNISCKLNLSILKFKLIKFLNLI